VARRPEPVGVPTLVSWHRTGLWLGYAALACLLGFVLTLVVWSDGHRPRAAALLWVVAVACGFVGMSFLQRVWRDPEVGDVADVRLASRLASGVVALWGLAVLLNAVRMVRTETSQLLTVVALVVGVVSVACFVAMLVLARRWSPG